MDEDTGLVRGSVGYPLSGDGARQRLLVGAGLHLLAVVVAVGGAALAPRLVAPPLVVPAAVAVGLLAYVPLLGYAAATIRELLDDEPVPPSFGDWGALLRDGRRVAGVVALYALPATVAGTAAVVLGGVDATATTASLAAAAVAAVLALLAAYVVPAAVVLVVERGATSAAWDREQLRAAVVDVRYLRAWLVGTAVAAVGGAVGGVLTVAVVGLGVLFAAQLAAVHAVTHGVVRSLGWTLDDPPAPPASGYVPGWDDGNRRKELSDGRLGGSLLPTTPGEDGETEPEHANPAGGGRTTDLDTPREGATADGGGSEAAEGAAGDDAGSYITPVSGGGDRDIEPADDDS